MVTAVPDEPTAVAPEWQTEPQFPPVGELRLNLAALGVDGRAPDFGERLCRLSRDNEPYDFQFSAQRELIVVAPSGPLSNLDETAVNVELGIWDRDNPGAHFSQTIMFRLHSDAQLMPDAAWITQERFDNLTERELRSTINGAPDFVVEARSRSDQLPPLLAKWRSGWQEARAWDGCWTRLTGVPTSTAPVKTWTFSRTRQSCPARTFCRASFLRPAGSCSASNAPTD